MVFYYVRQNPKVTEYLRKITLDPSQIESVIDTPEMQFLKRKMIALIKKTFPDATLHDVWLWSNCCLQCTLQLLWLFATVCPMQGESGAVFGRGSGGSTPCTVVDLPKWNPKSALERSVITTIVGMKTLSHCILCTVQTLNPLVTMWQIQRCCFLFHNAITATIDSLCLIFCSTAEFLLFDVKCFTQKHWMSAPSQLGLYSNYISLCPQCTTVPNVTAHAWFYVGAGAGR